MHETTAAMELDMYTMVMQADGSYSYQLTDPSTWGAWAHEGHRLWASMSEDFWVNVYKVRRCPQPCSHDWTSCPYAHKGERARRRDPRRFSYVAVSCPEYRVQAQAQAQLGPAGAGLPPPTCARGLRCRYAHGVFELWLHPSRFRTRMCEAGTRCERRICFFAHFAAELRACEDRFATAVPGVAMPRTPPRILQRQHAPSLPATPPSPPAVPLDLLFNDLTLQDTPNRLRMLSLYSAVYGDNIFASPTAAAAAVATTPTMPLPALMAPLPEGGDDDAKGVRWGDEEDSVTNDYPHRDLLMDLMR